MASSTVFISTKPYPRERLSSEEIIASIISPYSSNLLPTVSAVVRKERLDTRRRVVVTGTVDVEGGGYEEAEIHSVNSCGWE